METDAATMAEHPVDATGGRGGPGLEIWISYVLRVGVMIAAAIILVGLFLLIVRGGAGGAPTSFHQIVKQKPAPVRPAAILRGVRAGDAVSIIQLGVFALILTPVVRVAMTVVLFALQRERIFTLVTLTVFLILLFGLTGLGT
ncbi:MAG: DUF1634 domain-containing protein [Thermomicrobia bacterium]|nr:DUF1634 domain-containing protein [Thermomicrobia bacterium]